MKIMTGKGIKCPVCNANHPLDPPDVTQLPPNYAVLVLLRSLAQKGVNTIPPDAPLCEVCSKAPATLVCIDCQPGSQFKFCKSCEQVEHNRPFEPVRRHRRYPKDQVPQKALAMFCTRHKSIEATHFSESTREFACTQCIGEQEKHNGAIQFELISDTVKRLRVQAKKLSVNSREIVGKLGEATARLDTIINELGPAEFRSKG